MSPTGRVHCSRCDASYHVLPAEHERRFACTACGGAVVVPAVRVTRPRLVADPRPRRRRPELPREARLAKRWILALAVGLEPLSILWTELAGLPGLAADESPTLHTTVPALLAALLALSTLGLDRRLLIGWFAAVHALGTCVLLNLRRSAVLFDLEADRATLATAARFLVDHGLPLACATAALVLLCRPAVRVAYGISLPRGDGMPSAG